MLTTDTTFENLRQASLRTFDVEMQDKRQERVQAHFHNCTYGPGHLCFITVEASGVQRISDVFNVGEWRRLHELVNDQTAAAWQEFTQSTKPGVEGVTDTESDPDDLASDVPAAKIH